MTDYQRACEIVGCTNMKGPAHFTLAALEWLMLRTDYVTFSKLACVYTVEQGWSGKFQKTKLTEALTAAVLAVAGDQNNG